jgi:hypothetical protein
MKIILTYTEMLHEKIDAILERSISSLKETEPFLSY